MRIQLKIKNHKIKYVQLIINNYYDIFTKEERSKIYQMMKEEFNYK